MEFKFQSVDRRTAPYLSSSASSPSLSYFSEQALRANYTAAPSLMPNQGDFYTIQLEIEKERIGQEFIAAENMHRRLTELEDEMTRKTMTERVMPNPRDFYTIQLEIEKERIGQELIATENLRQRLRMLEEEVTRKLIMEKEMPMCRSRRAGISIDERLTMRLHSRYPLMHQLDNHWLEDRLAFSGNPSLGYRHNVLPPILAQFSDAAEDEAKSALHFTQKDKLIMLAKPKPNLCGAKRKATALAAGSQELFLTSLKKPKEWSCALCQVSTTSEQGLNAHLQGKKHKAKEAGLIRAQKMGDKPASQVKKSRKQIKLAECQYGAGPEKEPKLEEELSLQADTPLVVKYQKMVGIEDSKIENEEPLKQKNWKAESQKKNVMLVAESMKRKQANKKFKFWCENCQVGTHTAIVMEAHKKGKKHIGRLKEFNQNIESVFRMTSPMIVESSVPTENANDRNTAAKETTENIPSENVKDTDVVVKEANEKTTENVTRDSDGLGSSIVADTVETKKRTP